MDWNKKSYEDLESHEFVLFSAGLQKRELKCVAVPWEYNINFI